MSVIRKVLRTAIAIVPLLGECMADAVIPQSVTGYKIMSGDDFSLTLGGRVRVQGFYDVDGRQPGASYGLDDANLPLRKTPVLDSNAYKKGHFNYNLQSSRFSMDAHKKFRGIDYRGYLELDFNGNASTTSNSFTPRLRHGYFEACGWLVGQTRYTFSDTDAFITTLDNTYGPDRQAMIRFMYKITPELSLTMAAERPNTQSYQFAVNSGSGTTVPANTGYFDNDSSAAALKSQLPDGAMNLKYNSKWGHVALRGVLRDLQARTKIGTSLGPIENYKESKLGWGVGLSTKLKVIPCFSILAQGNYGKGIGRYIDDLSNSNPYDSIFIYPTTGAAQVVYKSTLRPIKAWNLIGGIEIHYTDKLWSNFAYSITKMSLPRILKSIPVTDLHRKLQRYAGNILYELLPNTQIGLEILHYKRKAGTTNSYNGKDTRIIVGLTYNI